MPTYSDTLSPVQLPPQEQLLPTSTRAAPKPRQHELRPLFLGRGEPSRSSNLRHSLQYDEDVDGAFSPGMSRNRKGGANGRKSRDTSVMSDGDGEQRQTLLSSGRESFQMEDPHTPGGHIEGNEGASFMELPRTEKRNFVLLVLLYFLQGIPMGLSMGSIPFLLKHELSYGQIGVFSLSSYPYSLKLFWSPIVDAIWSRRMGRRKSWIVPIQLVSGIMLVWLGSQADYLMKNASTMLYTFTFVFFMLVMLCATQDIAVDGKSQFASEIQHRC